MRVTIDIPADLLASAHRVAMQQGKSLSQLVEEALESVIAKDVQSNSRFVLRDASVGGGHLLTQPGQWHELAVPPITVDGAPGFQRT